MKYKVKIYIEYDIDLRDYNKSCDLSKKEWASEIAYRKFLTEYMDDELEPSDFEVKVRRTI